jgi:predicted helicase
MLKDIESLSKEKLLSKYHFNETPDWRIEEKKEFFSSKNTSAIEPVFYRPFDLRHTYYPLSAISKIIPRGDSRVGLMKNLLDRKNLALCIGKAGNVIPEQLGWNLIYCTNAITDMNIFYRGGATIFLLNIEDKSSNIISNINQKYNITNSDTDTIGYIYSILNSPTYRKKYSEFLKIDFPRIPFIEDKKTFKQLAVLGNELIEIHLMQKEADYSYGDFIGKGNNIVEKPNFASDKKTGRLYINKTQYFNNVPQEIYEFYIGGYQVLDKYLKDRKGRELNGDEVENVEKTIKAIFFTIDQMKKIDNLTKTWI